MTKQPAMCVKVHVHGGMVSGPHRPTPSLPASMMTSNTNDSSPQQSILEQPAVAVIIEVDSKQMITDFQENSFNVPACDYIDTCLIV